MDSTLINVPFNWRQAFHKSIDAGFIARNMIDRQASDSEVLLPIDPNDREHITEVRYYLHQNSPNRFKMYGRFDYRRDDFRTLCDYRGISFVFDDATDALIFKLAWG